MSNGKTSHSRCAICGIDVLKVKLATCARSEVTRGLNRTKTSCVGARSRKHVTTSGSRVRRTAADEPEERRFLVSPLQPREQTEGCVDHILQQSCDVVRTWRIVVRGHEFERRFKQRDVIYFFDFQVGDATGPLAADRNGILNTTKELVLGLTN